MRSREHARNGTALPHRGRGAGQRLAGFTFYNPRVHAELATADPPVLIFEGTYTAAFASKPEPTARHDYNQVLYRLDLDDPALAAAGSR